jgi:1-acyl-sn-glycerol-3-phosphate acyltransferase
MSACPYGETRSDERAPRPPASLAVKLRVALAVAAGAIILCVGAAAMFLVGLLTLFQARRFYAEVMARNMSRLALWLFGVRIVEHRDVLFPNRQTVYISNHTSALDMFVIIALGLPNSRYFLSGFLRKFLPLWLIGWLIGIFWTALQKYPERRTRIFQNAERVLRRTGESVFLTPEGQVTWRFNKGAFHLATALRAPILPIYILIPNDVDPGPWFGGDGLTARPGEVHVYYKPLIETSNWRLEDLDANRNRVREMYLAWKQELLAAQAGELTAEAASL